MVQLEGGSIGSIGQCAPKSKERRGPWNVPSRPLPCSGRRHTEAVFQADSGVLGGKDRSRHRRHPAFHGRSACGGALSL